MCGISSSLIEVTPNPPLKKLTNKFPRSLLGVETSRQQFQTKLFLRMAQYLSQKAALSTINTLISFIFIFLGPKRSSRIMALRKIREINGFVFPSYCRINTVSKAVMKLIRKGKQLNLIFWSHVCLMMTEITKEQIFHRYTRVLTYSQAMF